LVQFNAVLAKGFDGNHYVSGLASHFRDLMVSKNEQTIPLLEVSEEIKQHYYEQSQNCSKEFLLEAIELANSCDLSYRTSRNQRLLVELCLMKIASLNTENKKKSLNTAT